MAFSYTLCSALWLGRTPVATEPGRPVRRVLLTSLLILLRYPINQLSITLSRNCPTYQSGNAVFLPRCSGLTDSSPRSRGTGIERSAIPGCVRFIPARGGDSPAPGHSILLSCLRGSERGALHILPTHGFLSCLRDSERVSLVDASAAIFLSCLRGSKQFPRTWADQVPFLSCLRGSERFAVRLPVLTDFLSCLRGSEPALLRTLTHAAFLSCLRGSEHTLHCAPAPALFLSCLRGSELEP